MTGTGGNNMKIGIVIETDPAACKCRVCFPAFDALVSWWLPVLHHKTGKDKSYWMPDADEHVCCLMDDNAEFGVILGAIYSDADQPPVASQDKYHVRFEDGTWIEYDRATHLLKADVQGDVVVNAAGSITGIAKGPVTVQSAAQVLVQAPIIVLAGDVMITKNLDVALNIHAGGNIIASGDVLAGDGAVSLMFHQHTGVETGADQTGPPG